jgi:hypothetical protein
MGTVVVVDAANVVGSRPDGWWRDRAGAARRLHEALLRANLGAERVVLVLEGAARTGHPEGADGQVTTVHADGLGDDRIVTEVTALADLGHRVLLVTADRALRARAERRGAVVVGPSWLRDRMG